MYAGGDDVFLVGAWDEALDAGLLLQARFHSLTGGRVTLSGGLGMFKPHLPVSVMAEECARLEETVKQIDRSEDAIALFEDGNTFH